MSDTNQDSQQGVGASTSGLSLEERARPQLMTATDKTTILFRVSGDRDQIGKMMVSLARTLSHLLLSTQNTQLVLLLLWVTIRGAS